MITTRVRRIAAVAAVVTLGAGLAACSAPGGPQEADDTITWWGWDFTPTNEALLAGFAEEHPEITVEVQVFSYADYLNALRPGLTGDDGPDVFQVAPGAMLANYGPLAQDLGPLVADSLGADWSDDFNATAIEQLQYDGGQAALPSSLSAAGMVYYNSGILAELGLTVPTTVPEWAQTCASITAAGYTCLAQGAKDAWVNTDVFLALANSAEPGYVYDAIAGDADWTGEPLLTAMSAWQSIFTDGIAGSGATAQAEYPDAFNEFLAGRAAFIALGTWNTPGTMTNAGVEVSQAGVDVPIEGVFLSAPFPGATADSAPTAPFGGASSGWAISQKANDTDAAFTLIEYLSAGGGQELIGAQSGFPAFTGATVSTADVVDPVQVADIERQQASLEDFVGYREIPYPDLAAALGQALSAVAAGTQTPEDALSDLQSVSDGLTRE